MGWPAIADFGQLLASGVLAVRLSGAQAAVAAAQQRMGGTPLDHAEAFWTSLRDQTHPHFSAGCLWRLSLPSRPAP
jgi:glycolate oxidase FAD binding subunit